MIPEVPKIKSYFLNEFRKKKKIVKLHPYVMETSSIRFDNDMQIISAIYQFPNLTY